MWSRVPAAPADPILGLVEEFNKDTHSDKVGLSVGYYRNDEGQAFVLPSVLEAERRVIQKVRERCRTEGGVPSRTPR